MITVIQTPVYAHVLRTRPAKIVNASKVHLVSILCKDAFRANVILRVFWTTAAHVTKYPVSVLACLAEQDVVVIGANLVTMAIQTARSAIVMKTVSRDAIQKMAGAFVK